MDYEETLLQVTDVLKAHNRYHMNAPDHEQAVKAIRDIVTPRGKWLSHYDYCAKHGVLPSSLITFWWCAQCEQAVEHPTNFCPNCGADMRSVDEGLHERAISDLSKAVDDAYKKARGDV